MRSVTRDDIKRLPSTLGVYIFLHEKKPVYIGKAINIKARLLSHLENSKVDKKEALLFKEANSIKYLTTDSEFKALLLESKLIRLHQPKYNARWKDDKSYLYIKITTGDTYPKIMPARKASDKKSAYFGPFPSVSSVYYLLRHIRKIFPFCSQNKLSNRACFYSKIGLCSPCPNEIEHLKDGVKKRKLQRMYRFQIRQVIKILKGNMSPVEKLLYEELQKKSDNRDYEEALTIRNRLFHFQKLITQPLFDQNALSSYDATQDSLKELRHILGNSLPSDNSLRRIECYDISNLSQKDATGSMVVLIDGRVEKDQYRKFKIKNLKLKSDVQMLTEVIKRRFKNSWPQPDLIVVDGGKPQVRTINTIIAKLDKKITVIGIAKNPDRLILGVKDLLTVRPRLHNPGFNLIRHIRDESHRFARKYHIHLREKGFV